MKIRSSELIKKLRSQHEPYYIIQAVLKILKNPCLKTKQRKMIRILNSEFLWKKI